MRGCRFARPGDGLPVAAPAQFSKGGRGQRRFEAANVELDVPDIASDCVGPSCSAKPAQDNRTHGGLDAAR